jgi:hypothetical protein
VGPIAIGPSRPAIVEVTVVADPPTPASPGGAIVESNELNNTYTEQIPVT